MFVAAERTEIMLKISSHSGVEQEMSKKRSELRSIVVELKSERM